MQRTLPFFVGSICTLALAACGNTGSIADQNKNPLTASRYGDELADTMANLVIQNDPILQQDGIKELINDEIADAKSIGEAARAIQAQGMNGGLIPVKEEMGGLALYVNDVLYFSSDFFTNPGPDLHVYMTVAVDPRDIGFPDKTAIDLGVIHSTYGAQQYDMPHQKNPALYRTLVLFDKKLSRIYGFAQLSK